MALWLIGLGMDVIWNRPRQPTDNAKVERMQGTTANWVEPAGCSDLQTLERKLKAVGHFQRGVYPVRRLAGRTRQMAYPGLLDGGTPYRAEAFSLDRVLRFLAGCQWVRRVGKQGQVSFYGRRWFVGLAYRKQWVSLSLDIAAGQWVVRDAEETERRRFRADFLTAENIWALSLCQRTQDG